MNASPKPFTAEAEAALGARVSSFAGAKNPKPTGSAKISEIIAMIAGTYYQSRIETLRKLQGDAAREAKSRLEAFTLSGAFSTRGNDKLIQHSGVLCVDLDAQAHPGIDLLAMRPQLRADPCVAAGFVSPSGKGLKLLVLIDGTRHLESFRAAEAYFKTKYGLTIDPACKDVSRLCFASWDPEAWRTVSAVRIPIPEAAPVEAKSAGDRQAPPPPLPASETTADDVREYLRHVPKRPAYPEWIKVISSVGSVLRADNAAELLAEWSPEEKPGEYLDKLKHPLGQVGISTVVWMAQQSGFDASEYARRKARAALTPREPIPRVPSEDSPHADLPPGIAGIEPEAGAGVPAPREICHPSKMLILPSNSGVTISDAARDIFKVIGATRTLFTRGGVCHEVAREGDGQERTLRPVGAVEFRSRLERYGRPYVHRKGRDDSVFLTESLCAEETAKALLATTEARELLPKIAMLSPCPVLTLDENGAPKALGPGWHPGAGGIFVSGGELPPKVELKDAVKALGGLLDDTAFVSPGDRARALAFIIAPALRFGGLLGAASPIDFAEADQSQSGKTYRLKVTAAIYGQELKLVAQKDGGVGSLDESLAQALVRGLPFITLDNLRGKLSSTYLEAALTAGGRVPCRLPGKGEIEVDARRFCFGLTSNGIETTPDLANRSVFVRIKKQAAGYQFRSYAEGDLLAHVRRNQPYFLGCVFAVARAWVDAGRPQTNEHRHDFRGWVRALDWISQNILEAGPLMDGHREAQDRVANPVLVWLRAVALAVEQAGKIGIELRASELVELSQDRDIPIPGDRPNMDDQARQQNAGRKLKPVFESGNEEVAIDGMLIRRVETYSTKDRTEVRSYQFTRL